MDMKKHEHISLPRMIVSHGVMHIMYLICNELRVE